MDDNEPITTTAILGADLLDYSNLTITSSISPAWTLQPGYSFTGTGYASNTTSGKLELNGANADIMINGNSISDAIRSIEARLDILRPNPALEKEWDQLRELGEQYRLLEAQLLQKQRMWDTLKKMPPSDKV